LAGIIVSLALHNLAGLPSVAALACGLVVLFSIQIVAGVVRRNRRRRAEMDRLASDYKRGIPLVDDEGKPIL
jgi:hypothetical protein